MSEHRRRRRLGREAAGEIRAAKQQLRQNVASEGWWKQVVKITVVIAGYFSSSIALTFFQKRVILHHHFPLGIVICHLFLKFAFAWLCRSVFTVVSGRSRVVLPWRDYLAKMFIVAFCSAVDIGLSQWSFEFVSVTLYTMTKTTTVLFILMFAVALGLEKKHWSLIVIVGMISLGLFLFVYKSTVFNLTGFLMVLAASLTSGARWTFSQLIMQKSKLGLQNPLDFVYHVQPLMILSLMPAFMYFEGLRLAASNEAFRFNEFTDVVDLGGLILIGGVIAFVMEVFEYFVITEASSLTLSVVGIFKEICTILIDTFIHDKSLSTLNVMGMFICVLGLVLHVVNKAVHGNSPAAKGVEGRNRRHEGGASSKAEFSLPLLSDDDSDFSSDEDELMFNAEAVDSNGGKKRFKEFDDEFYLQPNRQWTSTRDEHVKMSERAEDDEAGRRQKQKSLVQVSSMLSEDEEEIPKVLLEQPVFKADTQGASRSALLDLEIMSD